MKSIRAISDIRGQEAWAAVSEWYKSNVRLVRAGLIFTRLGRTGGQKKGAPPERCAFLETIVRMTPRVG